MTLCVFVKMEGNSALQGPEKEGCLCTCVVDRRGEHLGGVCGVYLYVRGL